MSFWYFVYVSLHIFCIFLVFFYYFYKPGPPNPIPLFYRAFGSQHLTLTAGFGRGGGEEGGPKGWPGPFKGLLALERAFSVIVWGRFGCGRGTGKVVTSTGRRRMKHIMGNHFFWGRILGFLWSDLDENRRKSSWRLPGPSYPAQNLRLSKENQKSKKNTFEKIAKIFFSRNIF